MVQNIYLATGADPFSIRDFRERRVEAVDVVRGGAGITAEELPSILAHPAEFNVMVVFFFHPLIPPVLLIFPFTIREIIPGLPLDALLLLVAVLQNEVGCMSVWGWADTQGRYVERSERKKGEGCGVIFQKQQESGVRVRWGGYIACMCIFACGTTVEGGSEEMGGEE